MIHRCLLWPPHTQKFISHTANRREFIYSWRHYHRLNAAHMSVQSFPEYKTRRKTSWWGWGWILYRVRPANASLKHMYEQWGATRQVVTSSSNWNVWYKPGVSLMFMHKVAWNRHVRLLIPVKNNNKLEQTWIKEVIFSCYRLISGEVMRCLSNLYRGASELNATG